MDGGQSMKLVVVYLGLLCFLCTHILVDGDLSSLHFAEDGKQEVFRARGRMKRGTRGGINPFEPIAASFTGLHYHLTNPRAPLGQFLEGLAAPFAAQQQQQQQQHDEPEQEQPSTSYSHQPLQEEKLGDDGKHQQQQPQQDLPPSSAAATGSTHPQHWPGLLMDPALQAISTSASTSGSSLLRALLRTLIGKFGEDVGAAAESGIVSSTYELWAMDACTADFSTAQLLLPSSDKSASDAQDSIFRYVLRIANLTDTAKDLLHAHAVERCGFKREPYEEWAKLEPFEGCLPRPKLVYLKWGNQERELLKDAFVKIQVYTLAQRVTYGYFHSLMQQGRHVSLLTEYLRDITCSMQHLRDNIRDELLINHSFDVPIRSTAAYTSGQIASRCLVQQDPCVKTLRMFHTTKTYMDLLRTEWLHNNDHHPLTNANNHNGKARHQGRRG
ncbi:unnamed protein product [Notodromas monacha]|uniref:Uncharacterized protein n=1 Tax=Notodromas monacha TaxID=399045 RepID=A0A7R9GGW2_9CRUS|nr:unnamed protein product [Notodromas monacha]CAG0920650.1 unnamed protein product [Notodromas monacha]